MIGRIVTLGVVFGSGWATPLFAQTDEKPSSEVCDMVSAKEVEAVVGEKLTRDGRPGGHRIMEMTNVSCDYRSAIWRVELNLERGRSKDGVKMYMQALKGVVKSTTKSDAKPVPGLGDEAWWGPMDPSNGILTATLGTDVLWVHVYSKGRCARSVRESQAPAPDVSRELQGSPQALTRWARSNFSATGPAGHGEPESVGLRAPRARTGGHSLPLLLER
jgi:hypothetical protein